MGKISTAENILKIQANAIRKKPFYSTLFVTRRCNSICSFCNVKDNKPKDLTLEQMKTIIDEMDDFGIRIIALSGGEPMLRPDIFEILHYIESKKMIYSLVSNGTLWNEEMANEMRKRKIFTLSFSLDSVDRKKYRKIRGIDGLPQLKNTIAMFKEKPLVNGYISTLTTVTKQNIDELSDIIEFDRANNCSFVCGPVSAGSGFEFRAGQEEDLSHRAKLIETFEWVAKQCKKDKTSIYPSLYYQNVADYFAGKYFVQCDAGKYYMNVNASGGVSVCQDFAPFGNILETGLKKAFENMTCNQRITACAKNTPCFYGCTTFVSMLLRVPFYKKISLALDGMHNGFL